VTRFLLYLERVATPVVAAMGLAAAITAMAFVALFLWLDVRVLAVAFALSSAGFAIVGAAGIAGTCIASKARTARARKRKSKVSAARAAFFPDEASGGSLRS
jgi:apolipoprotein N-acyltransferase